MRQVRTIPYFRNSIVWLLPFYMANGSGFCTYELKPTIIQSCFLNKGLYLRIFILPQILNPFVHGFAKDRISFVITM